MDGGRIQGVCLLDCAFAPTVPRKVISLSRFSVFENLKKEEGRKREGMLERHKERSVFAGLCNCADLIGGERKTISLSRSSVLGK